MADLIAICSPVSWVSWLTVCPAAISGVFVRNTTRLGLAMRRPAGPPNYFSLSVHHINRSVAAPA